MNWKRFCNWKKYPGLVALMLLTSHLAAQELNCQVVVVTNKIQATNKRIFKTLETAIFEFMNSTRWTRDEFGLEERIDCSLQITIDKFTPPGNIEATIQVTASRPVYNASYKSSLLNFQDPQFAFNYVENAPIQFTPDQFRSNLASVLAFYAYYIIGLDYDSFGKLAGTPHFVEAQRVVTNAQNSGQPGWKSFEDTRNRFWMVDNILQKVFEPLREAMYVYHREGLDVMYSDIATGRKRILEALEKLEEVHQVKPLSFNVQLFFTAKWEELAGIFSEAPPDEKQAFVDLAKKLDPTHTSKYKEIL